MRIKEKNPVLLGEGTFGPLEASTQKSRNPTFCSAGHYGLVAKNTECRLHKDTLIFLLGSHEGMFQFSQTSKTDTRKECR